MERKTHIIFTLTGIYWLNLLFRKYWIENSFTIWYIATVSSFPLLSVPYQAIVTTLPDSDSYSTRLKKTILFPAVLIIQLITKHRWATHDIRGLIVVAAALFWLYLIWTNIIVLALISFFAITTTIVLIDQLKVWFLNIINLKTNLPEYIFSWILLFFFPILLIPEVYKVFLISLFLWYLWHMFWDMLSIEWWKPLVTKRLKIQLPLSFRVWWFFERFIIFPTLIILLITILYLDRDFWIQKIVNDFNLTKEQYLNIINNPEILFNDLVNFKEKIETFMSFVESIIKRS
jgi:hypothetical protein